MRRTPSTRVRARLPILNLDSKRGDSERKTSLSRVRGGARAKGERPHEAGSQLRRIPASLVGSSSGELPRGGGGPERCRALNQECVAVWRSQLDTRSTGNSRKHRKPTDFCIQVGREGVLGFLVSTLRIKLSLYRVALSALQGPGTEGPALSGKNWQSTSGFEEGGREDARGAIGREHALTPGPSPASGRGMNCGPAFGRFRSAWTSPRRPLPSHTLPPGEGNC